jgi:branched-subunit amino acid aminotransferase/4-amino-4-deoxychorismate lyase
MLATNGALYGKGIFTTIAIVARQPFLWEKHWKRLANNAATVGIDISAHNEMATKDALTRSIRFRRSPGSNPATILRN